MLGSASQTKVDICNTYMGYNVLPKVLLPCTRAVQELPFVSFTQLELVALLECWEDVGFHCPIQGCTFPPPGIEYKFFKAENQPLALAHLPDSKGFLSHWLLTHRARTHVSLRI